MHVLYERIHPIGKCTLPFLCRRLVLETCVRMSFQIKNIPKLSTDLDFSKRISERQIDFAAVSAAPYGLSMWRSFEKLGVYHQEHPLKH